jgi:hypothetical protein
MIVEGEIDVLAGAFTSQPLAFAHLLDVAHRQGLSPDFDHLEVIFSPHGTRLAAYFDAATVARLVIDAGQDALVLVLPGALIRGAFEPDARLRRIGRLPGRMRRAEIR